MFGILLLPKGHSLVGNFEKSVREVDSLNIPSGNPCRQHAYETLRGRPLPDSTIQVPGAMDNTIKHLEHPEVAAGRIQRAVDAVGERERAIASVGCGVAVFTDNATMTEDICRAKFRRLRAGAGLAGVDRLWS